MTSDLDIAIDRFRDIVGRQLGLSFDDAKCGALGDALRHRLEATGLPHGAYLDALSSGRASGEIAALAEALTVPETYFFRNTPQFRALEEIVLPDRVRAQRETRRLAVLSAGCASGEEPYSIAMLARDAVPDAGWTMTVLGIDVSRSALEKAQRGRYSQWALRETPTDMQRRWFRSVDREFLLDPVIRESVRFEERNLVEDDPAVWRTGHYDIIFCRNVLMYFTPDAMRTVVMRMTNALQPGGYLFLGHAETLRGLSHDFHLRHTHDTFYYRRKDRIDAPPPPAPSRNAAAAQEATSLVAVVDSADSWIEAIGRATERIQSLTRAATPPAPGSTPASLPVGSPWNLTRGLELLRSERFSEALQFIEGLPTESERDPDVLLLRGALLTQSGRLAEARKTSERLLELDELNAGAHYLLALCAEGSGDLAAARNHDDAARYLDPGFAMPRLHLGLMARRAGERDTAKQQLGQAIALLQREDASRLLLFGGGFGREALITLARAELAGCGGTR